jgi:hypothetical protein
VKQADPMELKEFVSRTISEIAEGVAAGAIAAAKAGCRCKPRRGCNGRNGVDARTSGY